MNLELFIMGAVGGTCIIAVALLFVGLHRWDKFLANHHIHRNPDRSKKGKRP